MFLAAAPHYRTRTLSERLPRAQNKTPNFSPGRSAVPHVRPGGRLLRGGTPPRVVITTTINRAIRIIIIIIIIIINIIIIVDILYSQIPKAQSGEIGPDPEAFNFRNDSQRECYFLFGDSRLTLTR